MLSLDIGLFLSLTSSVLSATQIHLSFFLCFLLNHKQVVQNHILDFISVSVSLVGTKWALEIWATSESRWAKNSLSCKTALFQEYLANEMDKYQAQLADADIIKQQEIKSEIQKNYAKAEVFFQTLNVVNIAQNPQMQVSFRNKFSLAIYRKLIIIII